MASVTLNSNLFTVDTPLEFTITDSSLTGTDKDVTIKLTFGSDSTPIYTSSVTSEIGQLTQFTMPQSLAAGDYFVEFEYDDESLNETFYLGGSGSLTLSKTSVQQGDELSVSDFLNIDNVSDPDGGVDTAKTISYSWQVADSADGANAMAMTEGDILSQSEVGKYVRLTVDYTDIKGFSESVSSDWLLVGNTNDDPTGLAISGTLTQGQTLSADLTNFADLDGYQEANLLFTWKDGSDNILQSSTSKDLVLSNQSFVGKEISLEVTYTDEFGAQETATASISGTVADADDAPVVDSDLAIQGTFLVGETLSTPSDLSTLITDVDTIETDSIEINWYSVFNGNEVLRETGNQYTLQEADKDNTIKVVITYDDESFTASNGVNQVVLAPSTQVAKDYAMAGNLLWDSENYTEDQTLTIVTSGISDENGTPTSFNYQWYRDGAIIEGVTTESYTLTQEDVGKTIAASVSYQDQAGYTRQFDAADLVATSTVQNVNDDPTGLTIIGSYVVGETISASKIFDEDGFQDSNSDGVPDNISYQWLSDGDEISGATNASYTLVADDAEHDISVKITYQDSFQTGSENTTLESEAFTIQNKTTPSSATANLAIYPDSDEAEVGTKLTMTLSDLVDENGISNPDDYTISWMRGDDEITVNGQAINDASYTLTQDDIGEYISVRISFTDDAGYYEEILSEQVFATTAADKPVTGELKLGAPLIVGNELTIDDSNVVDPDGQITQKTITWEIGDDTIVADTYTLTSSDLEKFVNVSVSYTDVFDNTSQLEFESLQQVISENTSATGTLSIEGNLEQGETLEVNATSIDDGQGVPDLTVFEWYRVDGNSQETLITSATGSSYQLTQADVGHSIIVKANFKDLYGSAESVSSEQTSEVINVNDAPTGYVSVMGTPVLGSTLTADVKLSDADGFDFDSLDGNGEIVGVDYQWYRVDNGTEAEITGATGKDYQLVNDDLGKNIFVKVEYQDDEEELNAATSLQTQPVLSEAPTGSYTIQDGVYVVESSEDGVDLQKPHEDAESFFISNKLKMFEMDSLVSGSIKTKIDAKQSANDVAVAELDFTNNETIQFDDSSTDFLLADASSAGFGDKLTLSDFDFIAVKGSEGLIIEATSNEGVEMVIDAGLKKLTTGSGDDKVTGSSAGEIFELGAGTNEIDAGDGLDFLIVSGNKADYELTEGKVSKTGTSTEYNNIEYVHFDDGIVTVEGNDWADELMQETWVLI